jgi:hypothetical protein
MIFQLFGGPQALKLGLVERASDGLSVEYGDLRSFKPQTSNLKPQTSNLKPQTSNLKPQTSNLNLQTGTSNTDDLQDDC